MKFETLTARKGPVQTVEIRPLPSKQERGKRPPGSNVGSKMRSPWGRGGASLSSFSRSNSGAACLAQVVHHINQRQKHRDDN